MRADEAAPDAELAALLAKLNETQRLEFRRAVTRQSLDAMMAAIGEEDEDAQRIKSSVEKWLANPSVELAKELEMSMIADFIDGGVRYHHYSSDYYFPTLVLSAETLEDSARFARKTAVAFSNPAGDEINNPLLEQPALENQIKTAHKLLSDPES